MTPADALREASLAGRSGQFEVSSDCLVRMRQRNVTRRDICLALRSATSAVQQTEAKWRIDGGRDDDGDSLDVVVAFTSGVLVVTVF